MVDLSDEVIRTDCPHCSITTQNYFCGLEETESFRIFCDTYPLIEGHILLVPKIHVACAGAYDDRLLEEFRQVYKRTAVFMKKVYGTYAVFEHGIFGQSVYHSHIHFLPFKGAIETIVPEGRRALAPMADFSQFRHYYMNDGGYLFLEMDGQKLVVDSTLATPRFFRKRFATALKREEREDWKAMHNDDNVMTKIVLENARVQKKWKACTRSVRDI